MSDYPLSKKDFDYIYSRVPRVTVEIILASSEGIFLTLRDIEPCKGLWHLPGGTVWFGETLEGAVKRIAKRELGITVTGLEFMQYIEYPSHYLNGLDSPIGLAFKVGKFTGKLKNNHEAAEAGWFKQLPKNMHHEHEKFLKANNLAK